MQEKENESEEEIKCSEENIKFVENKSAEDIKCSEKDIKFVENKSESWCLWAISKCSWAISKIKSCFCPRKKKCLKDIPEVPFQAIADFLNVSDTMAISFADRSFNAKTEVRRTEFKNLLDCVLLVFAWEQDIPDLKFLLNCVVDYQTGKQFEVFNYDIRRQTLRDFAEQFIRSKDINQYNNLMQEFDTHFQDGDDYVYEKAFDNRVNFIERLIVAGCQQEIGEFMQERVQELTGSEHVYKVKWNYKKQIQSYEQITSKSYESIYEHIKNNPDPKKPERENYIKAYKELKGKPKRDGYGCDIF